MISLQSQQMHMISNNDHTFMTISEFFQISSASTILAPADSYSASEKWDELPAPFSISTLKPGLTSLDTDWGVRNNDLRQLVHQYFVRKWLYDIIWCILLILTSGVAATRFSSGKRSLGTPTVNLEYGIPFGVSSSLAAAEKNLCAAEDDESCLCRLRSPSDRTLPGLMEARRIMMTPYYCFYFLSSIFCRAGI